MTPSRPAPPSGSAVGRGLPAVGEYLLTSVMALVGALLLCHLRVRQAAVTRFVFVMKVRRRQPGPDGSFGSASS